MEEPQSNLEEKCNPSILKDDFSWSADPLIFTSIAPGLLDFSWNKLSFCSTEIKKPLPSLVHDVLQGRFKFRNQF